ncbi:hypothetical protein Tco_0035105, partial [Tanacetum coccineum]
MAAVETNEREVHRAMNNGTRTPEQVAHHLGIDVDVFKKRLWKVNILNYDFIKQLSRAKCRPGKPSTVALNSLPETTWAWRCRPGKSLGNVSPSSFSAQFIPGDMSPWKRIPSDKSPGIPWFCR